MKEKNLTRLYEFYNINLGRTGMTFALCDKHKSSYKIPDNCIILKMADKSVQKCEFCSQEEKK